jgi:NAD(P)-dependent dehydrogenase (short-subunit alcohol dehydrogenase family)
MSKQYVALITGYTGESGKALLKELVENKRFQKIVLVGRRQIDYTDDTYKNKTVGNNARKGQKKKEKNHSFFAQLTRSDARHLHVFLLFTH